MRLKTINGAAVPLVIVTMLSACATVSSVAPSSVAPNSDTTVAAATEPLQPAKPDAKTTETGSSELSSASDKGSDPYTIKRTKIESELKGGLTYFLPTQLLKISVAETKIDASESMKVLSKQAIALAEFNTKIEPLTALREKIEMQIKSLPASFADAEAKSAMDLDFARAKGEETAIQTKIDSLQIKITATQAAVVAGVGGAKKQFAMTVELLPMVADATRHFVLLPQHNPLRDDELKFVVSPDGLLSSADIIATDRTGDIIVELASAVGSFVGVIGPASGGGVPCPAKIVKIINPADAASFTDLNQQLQNCFSTRIVPDIGITQFEMKSPQFKNVSQPGIYYRTAVPMTLNFDLNTTQGWITLDSKTISLPQSGPIAFVPATASAFVKTTSNMKFQNGMLTNWDSNRPSELAEIVRAPGRAINAGFGAISKVLQLKIDTSGKEKELSIAGRNALAETEKNVALTKCIAAARLAGVASSYCFE